MLENLLTIFLQGQKSWDSPGCIKFSYNYEFFTKLIKLKSQQKSDQRVGIQQETK
jgi:hypothetical protein